MTLTSIILRLRNQPQQIQPAWLHTTSGTFGNTLCFSEFTLLIHEPF